MDSLLDFLRSCVRPVGALAMLGAVIAAFFVGLLTADQFLGVAMMVIGVYFGSRTNARAG